MRQTSEEARHLPGGRRRPQCVAKASDILTREAGQVLPALRGGYLP
ncbi:MAG: hypothetical protein JXA74_07520 [Anaerolineae bacterium]|nr:hypothetical protein [Anaerolineae bacterium]